MKKILLLLLTLLLAFSIVGCGDEEDPDNTPTGGYVDPEHKKGTYKVEYVLRDKTVTQFYELNEIPEPPTVESLKNGTVLLVFNGWDTEIVPVSGNAKYTAQYTNSTYEYTATFVLGGGRTQKVKATAGHKPKEPTVADYQGMQFACWDKAVVAGTEDVTYTAVYTDQLDPAGFKRAYETQDFIWQNHGYRDMQVADALYALVLQEHERPMSGPVRDRIIAQIEHLTADGSAPEFTCSTNWPYGIVTACLAMAKDTPSVWDKMSYSLKSKVDTMMEAFAYIISLGTSDQNAYQTGPNFQGNYKNNWNANYALGSIPCMVFVVYYFGNGDMVEGAKTVNTMLKDFDEAAYNEMIGRFDVYGWRRAYSTWTKPALTDDSVDAKTVMIQGGAVVHKNVSGDGLESSSGKGVTNGGEDYRYAGFTLAEGAKIIERVIETNYSGGKVVSEHYFNDEKVGYIIDGSKSPFEGQEGMMLEFASGNRSSTVYCSHDFLLATTILVVARDLGIYDYTENEALWQKIIVGNGDFLYKNGKGYQGYSTGSYGVSVHQHGEKDEHELGYFNIKSLWLTYMYPSDSAQ